MADVGFMDIEYAGQTGADTSRFTSGAAFRAKKPTKPAT
jgi:hypothetical protein